MAGNDTDKGLDAIKASMDALHNRAVDHLFVAYLGLYNHEQPQNAPESTVVAGTLVAAFLSVAARVGQDLGLTADQLAAQVSEAHAAALAGAPKWG